MVLKFQTISLLKISFKNLLYQLFDWPFNLFKAWLIYRMTQQMAGIIDFELCSAAVCLFFCFKIQVSAVLVQPVAASRQRPLFHLVFD